MISLDKRNENLTWLASMLADMHERIDVLTQGPDNPPPDNYEVYSRELFQTYHDVLKELFDFAQFARPSKNGRKETTS